MGDVSSWFQASSRVPMARGGLSLFPQVLVALAFCGYFIDGICLVPFLLLSLPESLEPRLPNSFPLQGLALWVQAAALYAG